MRLQNWREPVANLPNSRRSKIRRNAGDERLAKQVEEAAIEQIEG